MENNRTFWFRSNFIGIGRNRIDSHIVVDDMVSVSNMGIDRISW